MKMESPLEVLSRAASIVQSEESSTDEKSENMNETRSPSEQIDRERRSPKRHHSGTLKPLKKLRLEENMFDRIPRSSETTTTTYARPPMTISVPPIKTSESSPPPLIAINERRKNLRNLPDYEVLFPRPSVISSSSPPPTTHFMDFRYQTRCSADCKCKFSPSKYPSFMRKSTISSVITRDFELPTVDDHFRKSLGDKYDYCKNLYERPSSVDDHFERALGTKLYTMNYGKCASS